MPAVPMYRCRACGEYLPHACAAVLTYRSRRWGGRRLLVIIDRPPQGVPLRTDPSTLGLEQASTPDGR